MNITAVVHPRVWLQLNDFSLCGSCSEVVSKLGVAMPHPLDSSPRTMEVKGEMMSGVGHSLRDSQRVLGSPERADVVVSSYKKTGLGLCHTTQAATLQSGLFCKSTSASGLCTRWVPRLHVVEAAGRQRSRTHTARFSVPCESRGACALCT